jgi:hypothetical protein
MVTASGATFIASLLEAGDAACGEPAQPSTAAGFEPMRWCGGGACGGKGRSERRKPEARELKRLAGVRDNKSIAEIGERHLSGPKAPSDAVLLDCGLGRRSDG